MNQKEFLKAIVVELAEKGIQISQVDAKEVLNTIENVIDNAILEGQTVKAFGCKFEQCKKENVTTGKTPQKDGTVIEWEKAPHTYPKASYIKGKKEKLTREI